METTADNPTALDVGHLHADGVAKARVNAQMTLATSQLIEALRTGKQSDVLTDEALFKICGKKCGANQAGYSNLQSAIRHVLNNYAIVWKRVVGAKCIKCLGPAEVRDVADTVRRSTHRREKRVVRQLGAIVDHCGNPEEHKEVLMQLAFHGNMAMVSQKTTQKQLAARSVIKKADPEQLLSAMLNAQKRIEEINRDTT